MDAGKSLQIILPFIGALIGIAVLVIGFKGTWSKIKQGDSGPFLIVLVSLLCTAYGVERLTYTSQFDERLSKIDNRLGAIETQLVKSPQASFIDDQREIWNSIEDIMLTTERDIRTVQASDRPNVLPAEFKNLTQKVADRLAAKKRQYGDVRYRVVLVFDSNKNSHELNQIEKDNRDRLQFYASKGLKDNVELRVFDRKPLMKFDVLIIDTSHVNIGFDTYEGPTKGNVEIQNTMVWKNQRELASKLARWFDETVWSHAKPFDVWLSEQKNLSRQKRR